MIAGLISAVPALSENTRIVIALIGFGIVVVGLIWGTTVASRAARTSIAARS